MINGLQGIPGSGKSYEAVVYHVLAALKSGRKVITNLPINVELLGAIDAAYLALIEVRTRPRPVLGSWNSTRVDDKGVGNAFELFPPGVVAPDQTVKILTRPGSQTSFVRPPRDLVVFGHVWDFYDTWRHADGRGPLFVIDECHVPFPQIDTDPQVVEWFKLHRHFNVDVLLMTQNFRDMNQPIANLIAILIKVRKADILGKSGSYIRKVHAGYRGAVISTDERKYLPQYFPLYKSHTQGNSVGESGASDVKPMIVQFNRFKWFWLAVTALYSIYAFWPSPDKPKKPLTPVAHAAAPALAHASAPLPKSAASSPESKPEPESDPEPLREKLVHITGWLRGQSRTVYTFAVSAGGLRVFDLQETDLKAAGYVWKPLSECMGYLTYKKTVRTVTCDPPVIGNGTNSAPVVIADGSRRSSADKPDPVPVSQNPIR